jgi:hypothetical protein
MVPVPVPVPTFEKLWFWFRFQFLLLKSYGSGFGCSSISRPLKLIFQTKFWIFFLLLLSKLFYKEKVFKFQQIYCKMLIKKINVGNQIHNFISNSGYGTVINYCSGSDFLTSYGSGSICQKVPVPICTVPVPVPQCCYYLMGCRRTP